MNRYRDDNYSSRKKPQYEYQKKPQYGYQKKPQYGFSPVNIFLGMLIGMIIMLVILTALYSTRTLIFEVCPKNNLPCLNSDYHNTPLQALIEGDNPEPNLFIKDNKLHFKKILRNNTCNPQENDVNVINFPQYCKFKLPNSDNQYLAKNLHYGSNKYLIPKEGGGNYSIETYPHCVPQNERIATEGVPVAKWTNV